MSGASTLDVLVTGAAGEIGSVLRAGLAGRYRRLVLLDRAPMPPAGPGEEVHLADIANVDALARAMRGVDCVVHLAGVPREADWAPILEANIAGCYNVFEAAREAGVGRVVFASSNHTVGYHRVGHVLDTRVDVRPDGRYGVSKVFGEAVGRLYADKFGLSVICLRIGSFRARPLARREMATWISHGDMVRLAACSIEAPEDLHFEVFYGVSNNRERRWTDAAAERIGFVAQDAAETAVDPAGLPAEPEGPATLFHGGPVCAREFAGDPDAID